MFDSLNIRRFGKEGFTLVELLLVIAILSILTVIGLGQFTNAQRKARDGQRKSDLSAIQRALEMYYSDNESFPDSLDWGGVFSVNYAGETVVYMKQMPANSGDEYAYLVSGDGQRYALYTRLQTVDPCDEYGGAYCWGVSSPNTTPGEMEEEVGL